MNPYGKISCFGVGLLRNEPCDDQKVVSGNKRLIFRNWY